MVFISLGGVEKDEDCVNIVSPLIFECRVVTLGDLIRTPGLSGGLWGVGRSARGVRDSPLWRGGFPERLAGKEALGIVWRVWRQVSGLAFSKLNLLCKAPGGNAAVAW